MQELQALTIINEKTHKIIQCLDCQEDIIVKKDSPGKKRLYCNICQVRRRKECFVRYNKRRTL